MKSVTRAFFVAAVVLAGTGQSLAATASAPAAGGTISTFAGGVGGPGPARDVATAPCGVGVAGQRVLFTDEGALRELNPVTDRLTTLAGDGLGPSSGDGGPARAARFDGACNLAVDSAGDIAIVENRDVRLIAGQAGQLLGLTLTPGHIYTVAGGGCCTLPVSGGPATAADLAPTSVAFDQAGNLIVTDTQSVEVLVVAARSGTFYGQAMTAGNIYPIGGDGHLGFSGDGGPATSAMLSEPGGATVDGAGNVVFSDAGNQRVRVIAERGGTFYGVAMKAGDIYTIAGGSHGPSIGDGGPALDARLLAADLVLDAAGNLLIADESNDRVRVVADSTGTFYGRAMKASFIYTVAGGPEPGRLHEPFGVAFDGSGNLLVTSAGRLYALAARTGRFYDRHMTADHVYVVAGTGGTSFSGIGLPATEAELDVPLKVADGASGALVVQGPGDEFDFPPAGVRLIAGRSGELFGQKMIKGHLYTVALVGTAPLKNSGPARGLFNPAGVAMDADGNALIADSQNNRIWVVAARTGRFYGQPMTAGRIYAIAGNGQTGNPANGRRPLDVPLEGVSSVTLDRFGDLVIGEDGSNRRPFNREVSRILVVPATTTRAFGISMTAGRIYRVAGKGAQGSGKSGGPATSVRITADYLQVDAAGDLFFSCRGCLNVRMVARATGTFDGQPVNAGFLYTEIGGGQAGFAGDGGPATAAKLDGLHGLSLDSAGNMLIADTGNGRIRVVAASSGTFYGIAMAAGDIYTIAGDGTTGFAGDGGPATLAELNDPTGVAATSDGVLICDEGNFRLRLVTG